MSYHRIKKTAFETPEPFPMRQVKDTRFKTPISRDRDTSAFSWLGFCKKSWWVLMFCSGCLAIYAQGMQKKSLACVDLKNRIEKLQWERDLSLKTQEDLQLQISSQNDPDWIELTLMKQLGVVPEGQRKVFFKKDE